MGNITQRRFFAAGISTLVFIGGSGALRAQGMRMTMSRQNTVRMAPSNMGFQAPGRGSGNNMTFSPSWGLGSTLNGRTNSSSAAGYGGTGYGAGSYGGAGGNGGDGYNSGSANSTPSYQYDNQSSGYDNQNSKDSGSSAVFKAMGLPVEQGQLAWPIGLQALRPDDEVKSLRDQIDGSIQVAALDRMSGRGAGQFLDQTKKAVARLRMLLRTNGKERFYASTYEDSARFLDQLESGLKVLQ